MQVIYGQTEHAATVCSAGKLFCGLHMQLYLLRVVGAVQGRLGNIVQYMDLRRADILCAQFNTRRGRGLSASEAGYLPGR